jgi:hypothetical protein
MLAAPDLLKFVAFDADGLFVSGKHTPAQAPVSPELQVVYQRRCEAWKAKVLSRPGGFDGERAALQSYQHGDKGLQLMTAYRSYTEGRALADAWLERPAHLDQQAQAGGVLAGASWGMSLVTFIRLPGDLWLSGRRSAAMLALPGVWSVGFTEMMEPVDIQSVTMQPLLDRLVREEMPSMASLGDHRFVGLSVRPRTYSWQLVSVLDVSKVETQPLRAALEALQPDEETDAWGVYGSGFDADHPAWLPGNLRTDLREEPHDFVNAQTVLSRLNATDAKRRTQLSARIGVDIWTYPAIAKP